MKTARYRYSNYLAWFVFSVFTLNTLHAFATPAKNDRLTLPDTQVSLESDKGMTYLAESINDDYFILKNHFETQSHGTYCGVATSVAVINSLTNSKQVDQNSYFKPGVKASSLVKRSGMSLSQLSNHFHIHKMKTKVVDGNKISLKDFRQLAIDNFKNPDNFLVINYYRKSVNQIGGGHISPLVAYHEKSDSILVMDTASYKYPPTWIKTESLWKAAATTGSDGNFRGIVEIFK
ncbi:phytochelatin synthase family protein [Aliikangiella sp. IMCC44359]|uniref:phytochelatin synthase family protein n=1 Tax=Aliikangiella sp. IMCC44359 TaxID=3459125 RepID=UPI00403AEA67